MRGDADEECNEEEGPMLLTAACGGDRGQAGGESSARGSRVDARHRMLLRFSIGGWSTRLECPRSRTAISLSRDLGGLSEGDAVAPKPTRGRTQHTAAHRGSFKNPLCAGASNYSEYCGSKRLQSGLSNTDGIGTGKLRRAVALLKRYLHDARIGEAPEQDLHRARREGLRLPRLLPVARPAHGGTGDRRALPRTCHPALRARAGPTAKVSPARVVRAALDEVDRCRRPRVHGLPRGVPIAAAAANAHWYYPGGHNGHDRLKQPP